jgi:hypothetical protein
MSAGNDMANKQENAEIAVLKTQMIEVKAELKDIKLDQKEGFLALGTKLDNLDSKYALKEDVKKLKWQTIPLTIIMTAVITALVYYFINTQIGG